MVMSDCLGGPAPSLRACQLNFRGERPMTRDARGGGAGRAAGRRGARRLGPRAAATRAAPAPRAPARPARAPRRGRRRGPVRRRRGRSRRSCPRTGAYSTRVAAVLVVATAPASRVRLYVGAGYAMPAQLVLVPMLFWLPAAACRCWSPCALVAGPRSPIVRGRAIPSAPHRVADAWYALGAAAVFLLAGEPAARDVAWPSSPSRWSPSAAVDLVASDRAGVARPRHPTGAAAEGHRRRVSWWTPA